MADTDAQINFEAAAVLTKCPSLNDESIAGEIAYYVVGEGTLGECIRQFTSEPMSQAHLYEIHTAPQGELITDVLSAQQIIELAALWGYL